MGTATFEVGGVDLGAVEAGFDTNFALAGLQVGGVDTASVQLLNRYDNQSNWTGAEALYVDTLAIGRYSTLNLNGLNVYYRNLDNKGTIATMGGSLTQVVPEPGSLALLLAGAMTVLIRRGRAGI
jgi:hypothetical protein